MFFYKHHFWRHFWRTKVAHTKVENWPPTFCYCSQGHNLVALLHNGALRTAAQSAFCAHFFARPHLPAPNSTQIGNTPQCPWYFSFNLLFNIYTILMKMLCPSFVFVFAFAFVFVFIFVEFDKLKTNPVIWWWDKPACLSFSFIGPTHPWYSENPPYYAWNRSQIQILHCSTIHQSKKIHISKDFHSCTLW